MSGKIMFIFIASFTTITTFFTLISSLLSDYFCLFLGQKEGIHNFCDLFHMHSEDSHFLCGLIDAAILFDPLCSKESQAQASQFIYSIIYQCILSFKFGFLILLQDHYSYSILFRSESKADWREQRHQVPYCLCK